MRLRLVNIGKQFVSHRRSVTAVRDVSLTIDDGEFFVLLGPSGCGKSTILNLIAGLEKPAGGEIWFDDRLAACHRKGVFRSPRERNVAFVFQSYALYPHLTAFENIAFPLRVAHTRKSDTKAAVERVASLLDISPLLASKPSELSGGQRQRVAIARAIVRKPDIFLLDEPLSNLDPQLRASTRGELKRLQRRLGVTTVYVTHDQVEAMTMGDRIAVLREGAVEQIGTPDELYERPSNTFVATFIGSPPMNLLKSSLIEENGRFFVVVASKRLCLPDSLKDRLGKLRHGPCILGIRPEHIALNPSQPLRAVIRSIESLGRELLVHVALDSENLSVLTTRTELEENSAVNLEMDLGKAHIFEA